VKAITGFYPESSPRSTFVVEVSPGPGLPIEEYTIDTHIGDDFYTTYGFYTTTYTATQEGAEVAQHRNMGALLSMLLDL